MNNNELEDKSSLYILGREFIIVVVVIFSGLSFTFGYFVGKMNSGQSAVALHQSAEAPPLGQKNDSQPGQPEAQQTGQAAPPVPQSLSSDEPAVLTEKKPLADQKTSQPSEQKAAAPSPAAAKEIKDREIIYTVQIGAFKSSSDADNFKANFDKKGYKSYITVSKNSKNETIYKIRTGEFKNKKDADIFSLKLKKNESLSAFVTFKNE